MRYRVLAPVALALAVSACGPADRASDAPAPVLTKVRSAAQPVPNRYIVVLQNDVPDVAAVANQQSIAHGGGIGRKFEHAIKGYVFKGSAQAAAAIANDSRVQYVEEDGVVQAIATQSGATWGLDRIDQQALPLDSSYTYNTTGAGVNAYIVDTGIRITHEEFSGRAFHAFTAIEDGKGADDCNGHGTHVAGTVGGNEYGVAKGVTLHAVRVLDCQGSGTTSGVIAGVDWVTANAVAPAVANMSLGGGASQSLDDAVSNSIAAGITFAVAAGNDNKDACNYSPARAPAALTVGATDSADSRASYSNFGTCLDIFAPGSGITSAWSTGDTVTNTISGTSMASPHVAGAAALYLGVNTGATPSQVESALEANATPDVVTSAGSGSPNLLLYSAFIGGNGDTVPPTASITAPAAGSTVSGTVTIEASATDDVGVTQVNFYVDGGFVGSDATAPYALAWDSTQAGNGSKTLTARSFDGGGNFADSDPVGVTVDNPGVAAYDATLAAPACKTVGAYCDTGTLVDGRGNVGPESNAPNTLQSSCADGNSGTYHSDESLDRLRVTTVDGTDLAPGKSARVEATVWAWNDGSADRLDLYYAADATSPSWTYLTTLAPAAGGAQTLSATFTLPTGGNLQAVRGNFRYKGSAGTCSSGGYDDRDDLVFAVGAGEPQPPTASFTGSCSGLSCSFTDGSTDPDGSLLGWSWAFGDGAVSTEQNPSYTYAAAGTYTVSLTVTDDQGLTSSTSQSFTVEEVVEPPPAAIELSATGSKIKGTKWVDLAWTGATSTNVDVYRDGGLVTTTANDGAYRENLGKGGGTYTYRVCEAGTSTCSGDAIVSF